jgi:hypothetical protein
MNYGACEVKIQFTVTFSSDEVVLGLTINLCGGK